MAVSLYRNKKREGRIADIQRRLGNENDIDCGQWCSTACFAGGMFFYKFLGGLERSHGDRTANATNDDITSAVDARNDITASDSYFGTCARSRRKYGDAVEF